MDYSGLSSKEMSDYMDSLRYELEGEGHVITEVRCSDTNSRMVIETNLGVYTLDLYKHHLPDFLNQDGLFIDLADTPEMLSFWGQRYDSGEILSCVTDITDIQPHEYGILKLKYGLEKHQLFIPSMFKPSVRQYQKEKRGGI